MNIYQINALIRRHYSLDPEKLDDEHWAKLYNEYLFTVHMHQTLLEQTIKTAVAEIVTALFAKI